MPAAPNYQSAAELSADGAYRYGLWRSWWDGTGEQSGVCWVMLNPSTADAYVDDATIRRCVGFSRAWGYTGLSVVNLFAYRTHNPKRLLEAEDPVGPGNWYWLGLEMENADQVVCAWGSSWPSPYAEHVTAVARLAADRGAVCLGTTKAGEPRHPLYLASVTEREPWG